MKVPTIIASAIAVITTGVNGSKFLSLAQEDQKVDNQQLLEAYMKSSYVTNDREDQMLSQATRYSPGATYTNEFEDGYWSELGAPKNTYEKMKAKLIGHIEKDGMPGPYKSIDMHADE